MNPTDAGPVADVGSARLACFDEGRGEPIVLVHGSASDDRTWRFQRAPFAAGFRVIRYSRRYHWPNEPIQEGAPYSMSDHVDDLERLLRALDATPAGRLEALLPDARHVEIPGAAHGVHEDNPEAYNAAVLRFIGARRRSH